MKSGYENNGHDDILTLEREISEIQPFFDEITSNEKLGAPPADIINSINAEAKRQILRRRFEHKMRRFIRIAAAASMITLILAGGMHLSNVQENKRREEVLNQLCIVSSEDGVLQADSTEASTAALAEMLMEMQGFDEDSYFALN